MKGKRVVIAEDEGITQMQLQRLLARIGMEVVGAAASGPRAVELALQTKPDLVLMDIRMAGAYDGLEAARRILNEQSVCIVILTAFPAHEYLEIAQRIGACGYISKPMDKETLVPQLEAAFAAFKDQKTHRD